MCFGIESPYCPATIPLRMAAAAQARVGSGVVGSAATSEQTSAMRQAITRAIADLRAINQHGLLNLETNQELYGRIVLGLPQNSPLI